MKFIHSKVDGRLLHIIYRAEEEPYTPRIDIVPANEFIQVSALNLNKGKTFRPHKHIFKVPLLDKTIAQESWCIIKGAVEVTMYDIDDTIITKEIIRQGDISVTLEGGHTYLILEDDTFIYEYKTGPYEGQERDKVFL